MRRGWYFLPRGRFALNNPGFYNCGKGRACRVRSGDLATSGIIIGDEDRCDGVFLLFCAESAHRGIKRSGVALAVVIIHEFPGRQIQVFFACRQ